MSECLGHPEACHPRVIQSTQTQGSSRDLDRHSPHVVAPRIQPMTERGDESMGDA
mgnify:CR=1 FL=1